jgi:hypothetical protein
MQADQMSVEPLGQRGCDSDPPGGRAASVAMHHYSPVAHGLLPVPGGPYNVETAGKLRNSALLSGLQRALLASCTPEWHADHGGEEHGRQADNQREPDDGKKCGSAVNTRSSAEESPTISLSCYSYVGPASTPCGAAKTATPLKTATPRRAAVLQP